MHWDGWMDDACVMFSFLPGVMIHTVLHTWLTCVHWEQNNQGDSVIGGLWLFLRNGVYSSLHLMCTMFVAYFGN